MNNLPFELLWGVDVAIKKLRPGANFQLEGTHFTIWNDPLGTQPPSWEEITQQIELDRKEAEKWMQEHNVSNRYPPSDGKNYI
jgi:hypothetical protein